MIGLVASKLPPLSKIPRTVATFPRSPEQPRERILDLIRVGGRDGAAGEDVSLQIHTRKDNKELTR